MQIQLWRPPCPQVNPTHRGTAEKIKRWTLSRTWRWKSTKIDGAYVVKMCVQMSCKIFNTEEVKHTTIWTSQARKTLCFFSFYKHRAKRVPWVFGFLLGQREQRTIENSALSVGQICLSLSPSQLSRSPIPNTLSVLWCQQARRPWPNPSHQAGLCRCSCRRHKYCRAVIGRGGASPRMQSSLQLRSWGRCRQHQSGSSHQIWGKVLKAWISSMAADGSS